ncbi:hypothetical protein PS870_06381 [Pseudomonas fluorescens]|uniref:Uncharacterized protein n=1 Tax=Pseudomonas fluorescens TaxID=294 RepID=A0A5E7QHX6_PSEFL|nr:hypothetical protein PS870_06381 [Pseudomonas fluorescens]
MLEAVLPNSFWGQHLMMCPDAKVEKVYLYPKPVDFRKSIDGLAALVELDIKVAVRLGFNSILRIMPSVNLPGWQESIFERTLESE